MERIYRRGKVTRENSIWNSNGSVSCPLSTNKWTNDEYFTIDTADFHLVEGRCWCVANVGSSRGGIAALYVCSGPRKQDLPSTLNHSNYLHQVLFFQEANMLGLVVDHVLHWTDNRRASVEFVSAGENTRRGSALFQPGRKRRA